MPNIKLINPMNRAAFPISGSDYTRVLTWRLILGLALIVRKGLSTLRILSALRFTPRLNSSIVLH